MALHFQHDEPDSEPAPTRPAARPEPTAPAADLYALRRRFTEMAGRRRELTAALPKLERQVLRAEERLWNLERLPGVWRLFPGLIARRDEAVSAARRRFEQVQAELNGSSVQLELACDPELIEAFGALRAAHEALRHCAGVWDISAAGDAGESGGRAMTVRSLPRRGAGFDERTPDLPPPDRRALRFGQEDVGVLRLYPGFAVACTRKGEAVLLHPSEVSVTYRPCRYVEEGRIPPDAELEDAAARPPRAELTMSRGFSARPRIVAIYGELWLHGPSGLSIGYLISDRHRAAAFAEVYALYRAMLGAPVAAATPAAPQPLRAGPRPPPAPQEELPPPLQPAPPPIAPQPVAEPQPRRDWMPGWRAWSGWPLGRVAAAASVALAVVAALAYVVGQPLQQAPVAAPRPVAAVPPPTPAPAPTRAPPVQTSAAVPPPAPLRPTADSTAPAAERTASVVRPPVAAPPAPTVRQTVVVQARAAKLRAAPSRSARVVRTERRGKALKVFARDGDWVQVGDARPIGWIAAYLLRPAP